MKIFQLINYFPKKVTDYLINEVLIVKKLQLKNVTTMIQLKKQIGFTLRNY